MKVFLMYPDRDFEPVQKSSPEQRLVPRQKLPGSEPALIQDLELNTLLNAMALKGVSRNRLNWPAPHCAGHSMGIQSAGVM